MILEGKAMKKYVVKRAFHYKGTVVMVGEVVNFDLHLANELKAAGKIRDFNPAKDKIDKDKKEEKDKGK